MAQLLIRHRGGGWNVWPWGLHNQHFHSCIGALAASGAKGALGQGAELVLSDLGRMRRADRPPPAEWDSSSLQVDGFQGSLTRRVQWK